MSTEIILLSTILAIVIIILILLLVAAGVAIHRIRSDILPLVRFVKGLIPGPR
ncbi:MAG: hypothetical protein ACYCQJ_12620 [Nitrososphaerales archaeon]